MPKALSDEMQKAIHMQYRRGVKAREIAAQYGIHPNTIYDVLERMGVERRHPRRSYLRDEEMREIRRLYEEEGLTYKAIAEKLQLSWPTVEKYGKRAGIVSRPAGFQEGAGHHAWKGGRITNPQGYILVLVQPDDPFYCMTAVKANNSRYCLEHRYVMAQKLGRPLRDEETVHHKDGDKTNNDPDNLQLRQGKHGKGACLRCADCGSYNLEATVIEGGEN